MDVTTESNAISWAPSDGNIFDSGLQEIPRVQKAYQRVAQKPFSSHRHTRTVWKRPGASKKPKAEEGHFEDGQAEGHGVKRQRLKHMPAVPIKLEQQSRYVSTLRDRAPGTPKRKPATRRSLRGQLLKEIVERLSPKKSNQSTQISRIDEALPTDLSLPLCFSISDTKTAADCDGSLDQSSSSLKEQDVSAALEESLVDTTMIDATEDTCSSTAERIRSPGMLLITDTVKIDRSRGDGRFAVLEKGRRSGRRASAFPAQAPRTSARVSRRRVSEGSVVPTKVPSIAKFEIRVGPMEKLAELPIVEKVKDNSEDETVKFPDLEEIKEIQQTIVSIVSANKATDTPGIASETGSSNDFSPAPQTDNLLEETIAAVMLPQEGDIKPQLGTNSLQPEAQIVHTNDIAVSEADELEPQYTIPTEVGGLPSVSPESSQDEDDDILSSQQPDDSQARRAKYISRISDDTNMLKDFLNRAQAARAAKVLEQSMPIYSATSPRRSPRKILGNLDSNSPSPTKAKSPSIGHDIPLAKATLVTFDADDSDEICEDPISQRRSVRTRLPAPARSPIAAPSFIPLRRTDRAEPILLQKSEAQKLAMDTRTNTRRNKGQAKMPNVMLQTLNPPESTTVEVTTKPLQTKAGKSVGWDEKLVYYEGDAESLPRKAVKKGPIEKNEKESKQEEQKNRKRAEKKENKSKEDKESKKKAKPEENKEGKRAKTTSQKKEEEEEKPGTKMASTPAKKRRLGELNGTPAPKKIVVESRSTSIPVPTLRRSARGT